MAFIINHVKIFSIQSYCLRLFGVCLSSEYTFRPLQYCMAIINLACLVFVISCEFRFTITSSDIYSLMANSFILSTRALATVKVAIMIWKRKDLQKLSNNLIDLIASDSGTDPMPKLINRRMAKLDYRCMVGNLSALEITLVAVVATPFIKWLISGENLWELPFLIRYVYINCMEQIVEVHSGTYIFHYYQNPVCLRKTDSVSTNVHHRLLFSVPHEHSNSRNGWAIQRFLYSPLWSIRYCCG
jgi:hypothetical protein